MEASPLQPLVRRVSETIETYHSFTLFNTTSDIIGKDSTFIINLRDMMSSNFSPDDDNNLLQFIASTVEFTRGRVNALYESVATKDELRAQVTAIRGDIEQVQLRLDTIEHALATRMGQIETDLSRLRSAVYLLSKERPEVLRLLGQ